MDSHRGAAAAEIEESGARERECRHGGEEEAKEQVGPEGEEEQEAGGAGGEEGGGALWAGVDPLLQGCAAGGAERGKSFL